LSKLLGEPRVDEIPEIKPLKEKVNRRFHQSGTGLYKCNAETKPV
jgi:hypothetical protein